jgi:hypothetical protein
MSTLVYASLTSKRDIAPPNTSQNSSLPGVRTYVDALAALVPTEALALHAAVLSVTTKVKDGTAIVSATGPLGYAFWGLLVVSAALYIVPRVINRTIDKLDLFRVFIPPLAFIGWMMLQRVSAFDAVKVFKDFATADEGAARSVVALLFAVPLGLAAAWLAYKADQKPVPPAGAGG